MQRKLIVEYILYSISNENHNNTNIANKYIKLL